MPVKKPQPTLGTLIDGIWALRETKRKLQAEIEKIEAEVSQAEELLLERMDAEHVDKSTGKHASVSISTNIVPVTKDWDAFIGYVIKSKQGHLVERRPATLACRELWEKKGSIPGLEPFTKRKANIRTIPS
jgi:hypothetical protein